jgi:ABC-type taurine transport system substrate-binding protein
VCPSESLVQTQAIAGLNEPANVISKSAMVQAYGIELYDFWFAAMDFDHNDVVTKYRLSVLNID